MKKALEITLGILTSIGGFLDAGAIATGAQAGAAFGFEAAEGLLVYQAGLDESSAAWWSSLGDKERRLADGEARKSRGAASRLIRSAAKPKRALTIRRCRTATRRAIRRTRIRVTGKKATPSKLSINCMN